MSDAEHLLVAGASGGGKTTYLRELHARHDGPSIFLTPKANETTATDDPPDRIRKAGAEYPGDIRLAREWARDRSGTVQVIVDECQSAPSFVEGDGPIRSGLHEDRSSGVKWAIATQSPSDLRTRENNYSPIQQCKLWVWCGPLKTWHTGFFRANGMSDMTDRLPEENYSYAVIDPTASLDPSDRIVYRGTTTERFA